MKTTLLPRLDDSCLSPRFTCSLPPHIRTNDRWHLLAASTESRPGIIGRSDRMWQEGWFAKKWPRGEEVLTWSVLSFIAIIYPHTFNIFGSQKGNFISGRELLLRLTEAPTTRPQSPGFFSIFPMSRFMTVILLCSATSSRIRWAGRKRSAN
jgi:hypothetical protein